MGSVYVVVNPDTLYKLKVELARIQYKRNHRAKRLRLRRINTVHYLEQSEEENNTGSDDNPSEPQ